MKNIIQVLGIVLLFLMSIFYTEEAVVVVRQLDDMMIEINKIKDKYKIEPIDAIITNDSIIPGLEGREVDENKSYLNMKRIGEFNENLLEYKIIKPKISLQNNFQKYIISGNLKKNTVSLLFIVDLEDDVYSIEEILNEKNIKASFFVNEDWIDKNNVALNKLSNEHILGVNVKNKEKKFTWINTVIKELNNQKNNYCYLEEKNKDSLNLCSKYKNYTIIPNIVVKNNPLKEVKENLVNGAIISFKINDVVIDELSTIINYISAKGYNIVSLEEHLNEKINLNQ